MGEIILIIIIVLLMLVGLVGTIVPFIPGIPLIYGLMIFYGIFNGWADLSVEFIVLWGVVTLLMVWLDYYSGAIGAKKFGASAGGVWGSILGGIVGVIFLGFIGILIGPFLGAILGELLSGKSHSDAVRSGWGTVVGLLAGSLFKIIIASVMIGTFLWQILV